MLGGHRDVPTGRPAGLVPPPRRRRPRHPHRFARQHATCERHALPAADHGVAIDDGMVAVVERRTVADLARRLVGGQLAHALAELATVDRAAVVVERSADLLLHHPHDTTRAARLLADQLAAVTAR